MEKPIEDNDNAKELWGHLSDASALDGPVKSALRVTIGAVSADDVGSTLTAFAAADNAWTGLQSFGGGFTVNSQSVYGPTATYLYLGSSAAAHRTALSAVSYAAQTLSSPQRIQARANIEAAKDTAFDYAAATDVVALDDYDYFALQHAGGTRRKISWVSFRIVLAGWINALATIAGAKTFTGTVKLTGLNLSDTSSAINVAALGDLLVNHVERFSFPMAVGEHNITANANGGITNNTNSTLYLTTGATAGALATAVLSNTNRVFEWSKVNGRRTVADWTKRTILKVKVFQLLTGSETVGYLQLGRGYSESFAHADWVAGDIGIGLKYQNGQVRAHVANGTTVTTSAGVSVTTTTSYDIALDCDGLGGWKLYIGGTLRLSGSGAPTTLVWDKNAMWHSLTNGASAANKLIGYSKVEIIQL